MARFELDPRLQKDCFVLGKLHLSHLLLMNNAAAPWFILVPETHHTEIVDLNIDDQHALLEEINHVSSYIRTNNDVQKLNIAAIGNIVSQLHVHIVGRRPDDYCWPSVVWGTQSGKKYTATQVEEVTKSCISYFGKIFPNLSQKEHKTLNKC